MYEHTALPPGYRYVPILVSERELDAAERAFPRALTAEGTLSASLRRSFGQPEVPIGYRTALERQTKK